MTSALMLIVGLIVLPLAAELLTGGAVALARRMGVTPLVIGLTIVSVGTSVPELVVGIDASLQGASGLVYGNVVGSNIANILLIFGTMVLIRPIAVDPRVLRRDLGAMLGATALLCALTFAGLMNAWWGAVFVTLLLGYMAWLFRSGHRVSTDGRTTDEKTPEPFYDRSVGVVCGVVVLSALVVVGTAELVVSSAVDVARALGTSEEAIGLTVVAIGTSLPELATAISAMRGGRDAVALGNVLGSNIFNILGVLGAAALAAPLPAPPQVVGTDMPIMLAVAVAMPLVLVIRRGMGRYGGLMFLALYAIYITVRFVGI